jgi:hypothetical protein
MACLGIDISRIQFLRDRQVQITNPFLETRRQRLPISISRSSEPAFALETLTSAVRQSGKVAQSTLKKGVPHGVLLLQPYASGLWVKGNNYHFGNRFCNRVITGLRSGWM